MAFILMIIGASFDFLDGFVARALKVTGKLGAELDSMADMVTFGTLPGMMMYKMLLLSNYNYDYLPYIGLLIPVFSGFRLAKFNVSENQSDSFVGLPTPMNALFISSLTFMDFYLIQDVYFLLTITFLSSYLLISNFKLIALKFKGIGVKENLEKWIFILIAIILLFTLQIVAIPFILLAYLTISFLHFYIKLF